MLIKCPECNKEVSDKCGNCPNCGFPIKVQEILYEYKGKEYNIVDLIQIMNKDNYSGKIFIDKFNINDYEEIDFIHDDIVQKYCPEDAEKGYYWSDKFREEFQKQKVQQTEKNIPKCPTCQSTDLSKISSVKKATKIGLFGIFGAGDIGKTWKCNNCGSRF